MKPLLKCAILLLVLATLSACAAKQPEAPMTPQEALKAKVKQINTQIVTVEPAQVKKWIDMDADLSIYDVRTRKEAAGGMIPEAANVPRGVAEFLIPKGEKDTDRMIVIYCKKGSRGALATYSLQEIGYTNVVNMRGGILAWKDENLPIEKKK